MRSTAAPRSRIPIRWWSRTSPSPVCSRTPANPTARSSPIRARASPISTSASQAIDQPDRCRAPLASDLRTYELTGFKPAKRFTFAEWAANDFNRLTVTAEIPYEQAPDATQEQKRLVKRVCTRYRANDLSIVLPQGVMDSQALAGESYKLAFTPGLLAQVYHRKIGGGPDENLLPAPAVVLGGQAGDQGGYVDLFADGHWWTRSTRKFLDVNADAVNPGATAAAKLAQARAHFYLPRKFVDPFGHSSTAQYRSEERRVGKECR